MQKQNLVKIVNNKCRCQYAVINVVKSGKKKQKMSVFFKNVLKKTCSFYLFVCLVNFESYNCTIFLPGMNQRTAHSGRTNRNDESPHEA